MRDRLLIVAPPGGRRQFRSLIDKSDPLSGVAEVLDN
jgi:hypothetical protein